MIGPLWKRPRSGMAEGARAQQIEFRVLRPNGDNPLVHRNRGRKRR